jgi:YD repeat-containing protein
MRCACYTTAMDYRPFELANEQCKPKHFGPPSRQQHRLAYDAAHRLPAAVPRVSVLRRLAGWLRREPRDTGSREV